MGTRHQDGATPPLRLYDTMAGGIREFVPRGEDVTLYVCGVTPYDTAHLGHAFTYVAFDVLVRYLECLGHRVRYVQNVTDYDDPLFERANQTGVRFEDLAREQTERYLRDMGDLNVLPAEKYPRASREIPEMIELVDTLLRQGHAYRVDEFVYFSVATDPEYGKLSKLHRVQMIALARERGGNPDDPRRRDPLDFVLWRPSASGEPREASPWGAGLPGWHLECSAMSLKYLDEPIDIHGGGDDLIFPHHESEIAQAEAATEREPFARYWMHTGMVHLGGEKMSKSLGNMVFARELMDTFGADAVRIYLSSHHYRSELHYDAVDMANAAATAKRLSEAAALPSSRSAAAIDVAGYQREVLGRLSNDLDTPGAIGALAALGEELLEARSAGKHVRDGQQALRWMCALLGLRLDGAGTAPIRPTAPA